MTRFYQILIGVSFTGLVACGNSQQANASDANQNDSVAATETVEVTTENDDNFGQFEHTARMVFAMAMPQGEQSDDFEGIVVAECTPSFIEALKKENDFEDGSIAWWALRTMEQDGPEDSSSIISITPDGNNAVVVNYSDMGHKASTRLEFVKEGDSYKVNSATVTYNGKERTIK